MSVHWLEIGDLDKSFDGIKALVGFSCSLGAGEILGLIGPNGAGKTTLFNVLSGLLPADGGEAVFQGKNLLKTPAYKIANLTANTIYQQRCGNAMACYID